MIGQGDQSEVLQRLEVGDVGLFGVRELCFSARVGDLEDLEEVFVAEFDDDDFVHIGVGYVYEEVVLGGVDSEGFSVFLGADYVGDEWGELVGFRVEFEDFEGAVVD